MRPFPSSAALLAAALAVGFGSAAFAHVEFAQERAPAGSSYKAVLVVGHGCSGSPTTKIRVRIPDGVRQVTPTPKPGWQLSTVKEKLSEPYESQGATVTDEVREIVWSGGRLPDGVHDKFVFQAMLPDRPGLVLHFPVVQECETGVQRWIDIPEAGKSAEDYETPAPQVTLTPKAGG